MMYDDATEDKQCKDRFIVKSADEDTSSCGCSPLGYKPPSSNIGVKYDQGKLLFGCFTQGLAPVIKGVVAVLTYGVQKYARNSWQNVPNARERYMDAFERHMNSLNLGEFRDDESGLPHIFHAICDLMFVAWFDMKDYDENVHDSPYEFNKPPEKKK